MAVTGLTALNNQSPLVARGSSHCPSSVWLFIDDNDCGSADSPGTADTAKPVSKQQLMLLCGTITRTLPLATTADLLNKHDSYNSE